MNFLQLDAQTWIDRSDGMVITDPGPGTALTVAIGARSITVQPPQADAVRARLGHNLPPLANIETPDNPALAAIGVHLWTPYREGMQ